MLSGRRKNTGNRGDYVGYYASDQYPPCLSVSATNGPNEIAIVIRRARALAYVFCGWGRKARAGEMDS